METVYTHYKQKLGHYGEAVLGVRALLKLGDMPLEGRREAARGMREIDVNREARMDVRQSWHLHSHSQGPGS